MSRFLNCPNGDVPLVIAMEKKIRGQMTAIGQKNYKISRVLNNGDLLVTVTADKTTALARMWKAVNKGFVFDTKSKNPAAGIVCYAGQLAQNFVACIIETSYSSTKIRHIVMWYKNNDEQWGGRKQETYYDAHNVAHQRPVAEYDVIAVTDIDLFPESVGSVNEDCTVIYVAPLMRTYTFDEEKGEWSLTDQGITQYPGRIGVTVGPVAIEVVESGKKASVCVATPTGWTINDTALLNIDAALGVYVLPAALPLISGYAPTSTLALVHNHCAVINPADTTAQTFYAQYASTDGLNGTATDYGFSWSSLLSDHREWKTVSGEYSVSFSYEAYATGDGFEYVATTPAGPYETVGGARGIHCYLQTLSAVSTDLRFFWVIDNIRLVNAYQDFDATARVFARLDSGWQLIHTVEIDRYAFIKNSSILTSVISGSASYNGKTVWFMYPSNQHYVVVLMSCLTGVWTTVYTNVRTSSTVDYESIQYETLSTISMSPNGASVARTYGLDDQDDGVLNRGVTTCVRGSWKTLPDVGGVLTWSVDGRTLITRNGRTYRIRQSTIYPELETNESAADYAIRCEYEELTPTYVRNLIKAGKTTVRESPDKQKALVPFVKERASPRYSSATVMSLAKLLPIAVADALDGSTTAVAPNVYGGYDVKRALDWAVLAEPYNPASVAIAPFIALEGEIYKLHLKLLIRSF